MLRVGRTYARQELIDMFHTERLDSIKRSLKRMNIEYETSGSGKKFTLTVTAAPDAFKTICVNELGIPAQSDFYILRNLFYYIFCDEELSLTDSALETKLGTTRQTIRKWIEFFKDKGLLVENAGEYSYYVAIDKDYVEITKEEYLTAWNRYWEVKQETGNPDIAFAAMIQVNGGVVSRAPKREENGFYTELIDALVEAIESEEK